MRGKASTLVVVGLAFFTDAVGYAMLPPLLPEFARRHGLQQTELGLLFGIYAAALLAVTLPMGHWTDRRGPRGPFLGGLLLFGAATVLFAFAGSYPLLLAARALQGMASAATWVAAMAMLSDQFPATQRGQAMSVTFACANVGALLGPAWSGWMVRLWSVRGAFLGLAGLAVLDALARTTLVPADLPPQARPANYLRLLRSGWVRTYAGAVGMGAVLGSSVEAVLPLQFARRLGMDAPAIGTAFTCAALASIVTSPLAGRWTDRKGAAQPVALGLVLATVLLLLAPHIPGRVTAALLLFAVGGTCSLLMSPPNPALASHVDRQGDTTYGAVFSLINITFALGVMVGPLVSSALTDLVGATPALALLAAGFALFLVPLFRHGRVPEAAEERLATD